MFKHKQHILLFITTSILLSCAQFAPITGGSPDKKAPEPILEYTYPANNSVNFDAKKISIEFDEYFTLSNPTENILISPALVTRPNYTVKGKSLVIDINNTLKPNTTYTIHFGESIKDLNAGNTLENFTYVFSTGSFIDSLEINGFVNNAFTDEKESDVLVMLYSEYNNDSIVSKSLPNYFSKTNTKGAFSIKNIKQGVYKLFVLKDENRNFLFDLPNEKNGFYKDNVVINDSTKNKSFSIALFENDYKKQTITNKTNEYPGKTTLTLSKPSSFKPKIRPITTSISIYQTTYNNTNDSIILWIENSTNQKFDLEVTVENNKDTITVYPYKENNEFGIAVTTNSIQQNKDSLVNIRFNRPLESISKESIIIQQDSILIPLKSLKINPEDKTELNIDFKKEFNKEYTIKFLPNTLRDSYQAINQDTVNLSIKTFEKDYYGTLIIELDSINKNSDYIIHLYQNNVKTDEYKYSIPKTTIKNLSPGKYSIHVLEDKNKNGKWDTGDYYLNKQPEKIIKFSKSIDIKSNWEVQELILVN